MLTEYTGLKKQIYKIRFRRWVFTNDDGDGPGILLDTLQETENKTGSSSINGQTNDDGYMYVSEGCNGTVGRFLFVPNEESPRRPGLTPFRTRSKPNE